MTNIYKQDTTLIKLTNERSLTIPVTRGIRQGCTGSTTLFKLITYAIMKKLKEGRGFNNTNIHINSLFLLINFYCCHTIDGAQRSFSLLTELNRKCGLEKKKKQEQNHHL